MKVIEDLFDSDALDIMQRELGITGKPKKGQILRFCQERLASDGVIPLGTGFEKAATAALQSLTARLGR